MQKTEAGQLVISMLEWCAREMVTWCAQPSKHHRAICCTNQIIRRFAPVCLTPVLDHCPCTAQAALVTCCVAFDHREVHQRRRQSAAMPAALFGERCIRHSLPPCGSPHRSAAGPSRCPRPCSTHGMLQLLAKRVAAEACSKRERGRLER